VSRSAMASALRVAAVAQERECAAARLLVQMDCAGLALAGRLFGRTGGAGRLSVLVRRRVCNKFAAEISVAVNVGEGDVLGRWVQKLCEAVVEKTNVLR
jgi:hypothetical protein